MSLYDDASLIMYPSGYKASKIYSQKPTDGSGDLTFTRASTKTYIDANGARQTAAENVMPVSYEGGGCGKFNFEPQTTNLLLNSDTLSTQNITTTAQSYVLSFEGTGTVTLSGTYADSLVGTGATPADRVNLVFTATAGTLTVTVSGSVLNAQIEAGTYPTSYIPTSGTTVTRVADTSSTSGLSSVIGQSEGTLFIKMAALADASGNRFISLSDGTLNNRVSIGYTVTSNQIQYFIRAGGVSQATGSATISDVTDFRGIAVKYKENDFAVWVDGVEVLTNLSGVTFGAGVLTSIIMTSGNASTNRFEGKIQNIMLFQTALSDLELEALTTL